MTESNRQKKISGLLQKDLASILQELLRKNGQSGIIVSVSKVSVTVDLSLAKVYVSVFPSEKGTPIVKELNELKPVIKHQMAQLTKNQLRKMPDLTFYNDDSLEYIDQIEKAVKVQENPIKDPDLLPKRKKS
ncbi:MAG: 30S ribosome-binding factor RbfA [Flavobacteriaceae bacterium]